MKKINFIIFLCFFLSGVSGLIYEVVWAKYLTLIFGSTAYAHSLVLATFMGGLALGGFLLGRVADKIKNCLIFYAVIEIIIGIFCLFTPYLFSVSRHFYIYLAGNFLLGTGSMSIVKFLIRASIMLPPTILMGGTLPILAKVIIRSPEKRGELIARLYCINSLGAVIGTLLAGFYFIYYFGFYNSVLIAVVINILIGIVALIPGCFYKTPSLDLTKKKSKTEPQTQQQSSFIFSDRTVKIALTGIFVSGFTAMLYEIVWIRLLTLVLGGSTYSFSLMLAAFIFGITAGSYIISKFMPKDKLTFLFFGLCELFIAVLLIVTIPFYEQLPFLFMKFSGYFVRNSETFIFYSIIKFFLSFLVMILPTIFLGMTIPLVTKITSYRLHTLGKEIGSVLALNTTGNIFGALITGLILIRFLGLRHTLELGILLNILIGVIVLLNDKTFSIFKSVIVCLVSFIIFFTFYFYIPSWNNAGFSIQAFRGSEIKSVNYSQYKKMLKNNKKHIVFHEDGLNATVSVLTWAGQYSLFINGKADASSKGDMNTQILSAQIPLIMLKPDAKNVMVIGLGSGVTCGSALLHPIDSLDILEISPLVVKANTFFTSVNYNALANPRLHLFTEDARTFLHKTQKKYDIIISEPSNPWLSGTGALFSIEFFETCKKHIAKNGMMVQWVQTYSISQKTFSLILRTFSTVFPKVQIWKCGSNNILLVGSEKDVEFDLEKSLKRLNNNPIKLDLSRINVKDFFTLLNMQLAVNVQSFKNEKGLTNREFYPILEYIAPVDLFNQAKVNIFSVFPDQRRSPSNKSKLFIEEYLKKNEITYQNYYFMYRYFLSDIIFNDRMIIPLVDQWTKEYPEDKNAVSAQCLYNIDRLKTKINTLEKSIAKDQSEQNLNKYSLELLKQYEILRSFYDPSIIAETALKLLNCAQLSKDNKVRYYYLIGSILMNHKNYKHAIDYFLKSEKTINLQKNVQLKILYTTNIYNQLSYAYYMENIFKKAYEYAKKALAINKNSPLAKKVLNQIKPRKISEQKL